MFPVTVVNNSYKIEIKENCYKMTKKETIAL